MAAATAAIVFTAGASGRVGVAAVFVGFEVLNVPDGATVAPGEYGCMPALFSGNPSGASLSKLDMVVADPIEACGELSNAAEVAGKAVLVRRGGCLFSTKYTWTNHAGAAALVVFTQHAGEIPFQMSGRSAGLTKVAYPVCMTFNDVGVRMATALAPTSGSAAAPVMTVSFASSFEVYDPSKEALPLNPVSSIRVVQPSTLRGDVPAGQATFNPPTTSSVVAKLVVAEWTSDCALPYTGDDACYRCWADGAAFSNRAAMAGAVVLYHMDTNKRTPACYTDFHELAWLAQGAGAFGSLFAFNDRTLYTLAPNRVPYAISIPMFSVFAADAADWQQAALDHGIDMVVRLPPLSSGSGPDYFAPAHSEGALPETRLSLSYPDGGSGSGSGSGSLSLLAGQTAFNPKTAAAVSAPLVQTQWAPECKLADSGSSSSSASGGSEAPLVGVDCHACHAKLRAGTALVTPAASLAGKVAFVQAADTYCLDSWQEVVQVLQDLPGGGVAGALVGMLPDYTMTLPAAAAGGDTRAARLNVPTFNVASAAAARVAGLLFIAAGSATAAPFTVTAQLPALADYLAPTAAAEADEALPLSLVRITKPSAAAGVLPVGQSLFSPRNSGRVTGSLVLGVIRSQCNSALSCHDCSFGRSPFSQVISLQSSVWLRQGYSARDVDMTATPSVVLVNVTEARCMGMPAYVQQAHALGAVGVLFVNPQHGTPVGVAADSGAATGEALVTMGPAMAAEDTPAIPSFNMAHNTAVRLMASGTSARVEIQLPAIADGVAEALTPPLEAGLIAGRDAGDVGEGNDGDVPVGGIVAGVIGAVVVGVLCGVGWVRWRRARRLHAYNRMDASLQTTGIGIGMGGPGFDDDDTDSVALDPVGPDASAATGRGGGRGGGRLASLPLASLDAMYGPLGGAGHAVPGASHGSPSAGTGSEGVGAQAGGAFGYGVDAGMQASARTDRTDRTDTTASTGMTGAESARGGGAGAGAGSGSGMAQGSVPVAIAPADSETPTPKPSAPPGKT